MSYITRSLTIRCGSGRNNYLTTVRSHNDQRPPAGHTPAELHGSALLGRHRRDATHEWASRRRSVVMVGPSSSARRRRPTRPRPTTAPRSPAASVRSGVGVPASEEERELDDQLGGEVDADHDGGEGPRAWEPARGEHGNAEQHRTRAGPDHRTGPGRRRCRRPRPPWQRFSGVTVHTLYRRRQCAGRGRRSCRGPWVDESVELGGVAARPGTNTAAGGDDRAPPGWALIAPPGRRRPPRGCGRTRRA
jgi:hypothetical protein